VSAPSPKPLTVAGLMLLLSADVTASAKGHRGTVSVAGDRFNAVELLGQSAGQLRFIISYSGWKKRGDYEETRAVDHTFKVCVSTGRLMTAVQGAGLMQIVAGQKPLFDLVNRLGARLHAIEFPDKVTEGTLDITDCNEVQTPDGTLVDAYEITATLGATQSDEQ